MGKRFRVLAAQVARGVAALMQAGVGGSDWVCVCVYCIVAYMSISV